MAVEQGCFEVDQSMLNAGSHAVQLSGAPEHVLATVRRGPNIPTLLGGGRPLTDKVCTVNGSTVTFSMNRERVGNCICWTAYMP